MPLPTLRYTLNENESLSNAIITALSEAKNRDITEEECILYDNIDPDALNNVFRNRQTKDTIKVEFTTHDAIVILWCNEKITIEVQDLESDLNHQ